MKGFFAMLGCAILALACVALVAFAARVGWQAGGCVA